MDLFDDEEDDEELPDLPSSSSPLSSSSFDPPVLPELAGGRYRKSGLEDRAGRLGEELPAMRELAAPLADFLAPFATAFLVGCFARAGTTSSSFSSAVSTSSSSPSSYTIW